LEEDGRAGTVVAFRGWWPMFVKRQERRAHAIFGRPATMAWNRQVAIGTGGPGGVCIVDDIARPRRGHWMALDGTGVPFSVRLGSDTSA
jgi:hypothetical protein